MRQAYYAPKMVEAKQFCEALFPRLEAAKQHDGKYPRAIDPSWLEGRRFAEFIDPRNFSTILEQQVYQMVLHQPIECTPLIGH